MDGNDFNANDRSSRIPGHVRGAGKPEHPHSSPRFSSTCPPSSLSEETFEVDLYGMTGIEALRRLLFELTKSDSIYTEQKQTQTVMVKAEDVGVQPTAKRMYSGKEDQHHRFQWQDEIPSDLGVAMESNDTNKHALIERFVSVYNNPQKVLTLHSITVQSPLIKRFLEPILAKYPGVSMKLDRVEFSGHFAPLIHRWSAMEQAYAALTEPKDTDVKIHVALLLDLLKQEFATVLSKASNMRQNSVISFELLWILFEPGDILYLKRDKCDVAVKLLSARYIEATLSPKALLLGCQEVAFDGSRFGSAVTEIKLEEFEGIIPITQLSAYPLACHADVAATTSKLIARGALVEGLAGVHYKAYDGVGWRVNRGTGKEERTTIKGRIVIDAATWLKRDPDDAILNSLLDDISGLSLSGPSRIKPAQGTPGREMYRYGTPRMPASGFRDFLRQESMASSSVSGLDSNQDNGTDAEFPGTIKDKEPLTDELRLIVSPILRGYDLQQKDWVKLYADYISDIAFSPDAFDSLVLPSDQKDLIRGFTKAFTDGADDGFDDVIENKGKGIVILLSGPPGTGKTLTAESTAELLQVPLYILSAGDLGHDAVAVETKLRSVLSLVSTWNALLLIDEADIFLEQRNLHELERNKLVTIFLRLLEYFQGIMFLTTNRVATFDTAFQSRIHISIEFPELTYAMRRTIWQNFLQRRTRVARGGDDDAPVAMIDHAVSDADVDALAHVSLNGRQIKNVLRTASLLARARGRPLVRADVQKVLGSSMALHDRSVASEEAKGAIFN